MIIMLTGSTFFVLIIEMKRNNPESSLDWKIQIHIFQSEADYFCSRLKFGYREHEHSRRPYATAVVHSSQQLYSVMNFTTIFNNFKWHFSPSLFTEFNGEAKEKKTLILMYVCVSLLFVWWTNADTQYIKESKRLINMYIWMNVVYSLLTYYIQFPHGLQVEAINIGVFSSTGYRFAIIVRCWYKTQFRTCRIIRCVILQQQ